MPTQVIRLDGATFHVEVDEAASTGPHRIAANDSDRPGLTPTGVADRIADAGSELHQMVASVTSSMRTALEKSAPTEWAIELSIGFKGEAGIPYLTKGQANATIKLTATWKRTE